MPEYGKSVNLALELIMKWYDYPSIDESILKLQQLYPKQPFVESIISWLLEHTD